MTFAFHALRWRPHFVGGFHLLFNGLAASLLSRVCGARSMYFCVGGGAEIEDGGLMSENRLFEKIGQPDLKLEQKLVCAIGYCDQIVTMGERARNYFRARGIRSNIDVVSGGIDLPDLKRRDATPDVDVIFVGRLAPIKRVDLFIETVAMLLHSFPEIRAVIVGDGALRDQLGSDAERLGLSGHLQFAGFAEDVSGWLARSKIFVLTSDCEGLSLALMEAMAWGLPAVVSDVGELADLVKSGVSGELVAERTAAGFATAVAAFLSDSNYLARASREARRAAEKYAVPQCALRWQSIIDRYGCGGK